VDLTIIVKKIKTITNSEAQIMLAKQYYMRLQTEAKSKNTLDEMLAHNKKVKHAEGVLHNLRRRIFEIDYFRNCNGVIANLNCHDDTTVENVGLIPNNDEKDASTRKTKLIELGL
jgi:hypothetical protein